MKFSLVTLLAASPCLTATLAEEGPAPVTGEESADPSTCEDGFVSAGGIVVDAGGVEVNSGGVNVASGGVVVKSGGLKVEDGGAVYQSTAGFALEVVGKTSIKTTGENSPALAIDTSSVHFEDALLSLRTSTQVNAEEYDFIVAHNGHRSGNETMFRVDGGGNVHTVGTVHVRGHGTSWVDGTLGVHGNFTVGRSAQDVEGADTEQLSVTVDASLDVSASALFHGGVTVAEGGLTLSAAHHDNSESDAPRNILAIDDNSLSADTGGTIRFRRGKTINGSLYSAATNDQLGAVEFAAFDDDPGRSEYRSIAQVSAQMVGGMGNGHLVFSTSRNSGPLIPALEVDSSQGVTFMSNATALGGLLTRSRLDSSNPNSGALVSRGGLGVSKNAHIGGRVTIENSAAPRMVSAVDGALEPSPPSLLVRGDTDISGSLRAGGGIRIASNDAASDGPALVVDGVSQLGGSATILGSLVVDSDESSPRLGAGAVVTQGGLSVGGDVNVGGSQTLNGEAIFRNDATVDGQLHIANVADVDGSDNGGALVVDGGAAISRKLQVGGPGLFEDDTNAEDATSGSLVTNGGLGVGRDIFAGGRVVIADELIVSGRIHALGGMAYAPTTESADGDTKINYLGGGGATLHTGGSLVVAATADADEVIESQAANLEVQGGAEIGGGLAVSGGDVFIVGADATLALEGENSQLRVASSINSANSSSGAVVVAGGVGVGQNLTVGGQLFVADDTKSKSTTTGSIVTPGGVGIGGNLNIEGDINLYGTLYGWSGLTGVFPDYVFDEDYPLMRISELAQFVAEHKHLPGVPSAAEVAADGKVDLVEFSRTLLEKIEELSLYVVQLEQKSEAQDARQTQLEERMERLEAAMARR